MHQFSLKVLCLAITYASVALALWRVTSLELYLSVILVVYWLGYVVAFYVGMLCELLLGIERSGVMLLCLIIIFLQTSVVFFAVLSAEAVFGLWVHAALLWNLERYLLRAAHSLISGTMAAIRSAFNVRTTFK